jgi:hypothetical protein
MFDLEQSISDWRRRLAAGGLNRPEVLDELESHLRDAVDQQVHSNVDALQAFEWAVRRIGPAIELTGEFEKAISNPDNPNEPMKQKLIRILASIGVMFIAIGLLLPAIAKLREVGTLAGFDITMLLVGTVLLAGSILFAASGIVHCRQA